MTSGRGRRWGRGPGTADPPLGTCGHMCPERERTDRERQRRLHRFEVLSGTERDSLPAADPQKAVKEYSRPAAGRETPRPEDLRPPDVLFQTVAYLVDRVVPRQDVCWGEVYGYVFDRLRSVRQDMTVQRIGGKLCVAVLERTLRFLLYASYRLRGEPPQVFDPDINSVHTQECFSWLLETYRLGDYDSEAEFQSLFILYNLGSMKALHYALLLSDHIRDSPCMKSALAVNRAFTEGNYVRFFRLCRRLPFLASCALHRHIGHSRRCLIRIFSHGFSSRNCRYPLERLVDLLAADDWDSVVELCQKHGVTVTNKMVGFQKANYKELGPLSDGPSHVLVGHKQGDITVSAIIHGN
ncbi:SAC3 domain-containing protein 1-like [Callorhinchus milii]|uniref:SAC3 domain-containing protein 1-like n=1 Tax=Callorhinchus milii TaxID=7868 RepID=A0A4W3H7D8_CALMI|nr:SAC3 domain-containing protein 1-like [Callorhinchus milii]